MVDFCLTAEQKGRRKDLLREMADKWMTQAEGIKPYLAVKKVDNIEEQKKEDDDEASLFKTGLVS